MAIFARTNPQTTTTNFENVGKDISFFTVDYINAVDGSAGPNGAQQAVLRVIQEQHTIIAAGPLGNSNTEQTFAIEGPLYTPQNGSSLQDRIRALGATGGATGYLLTGDAATSSANVDVSSATVTAKDFYIAV
jgi:hypothetical protein